MISAAARKRRIAASPLVRPPLAKAGEASVSSRPAPRVPAPSAAPLTRKERRFVRCPDCSVVSIISSFRVALGSSKFAIAEAQPTRQLRLRSQLLRAVSAGVFRIALPSRISPSPECPPRQDGCQRRSSTAPRLAAIRTCEGVAVAAANATNGPGRVASRTPGPFPRPDPDRTYETPELIGSKTGSNGDHPARIAKPRSDANPPFAAGLIYGRAWD